MSHQNHHAPLTMNLGLALQAAGVQPVKKGIPARMGIDIVVTPSTAPTEAPPMGTPSEEDVEHDFQESYEAVVEAQTGQEERRERLQGRRRVMETVLTQNSPVSGHKNNESEATDHQNNVTKENTTMNTQNNVSENNGAVNGSNEAVRSPQPAKNFTPEEAAIRLLDNVEKLTTVAMQMATTAQENDKRRTDALVAIANEVAPKRNAPSFTRRDRTGMKLVVTGTFAIAGGVGAGVAAQRFVPGISAQDTMGAVSLGTIGGVLIGAGVSEGVANLLDSRADKKAKEEKKDAPAK